MEKQIFKTRLFCVLFALLTLILCALSAVVLTKNARTDINANNQPAAIICSAVEAAEPVCVVETVCSAAGSDHVAVAAAKPGNFVSVAAPKALQASVNKGLTLWGQREKMPGYMIALLIFGGAVVFLSIFALIYFSSGKKPPAKKPAPKLITKLDDEDEDK